MNNEPVLIVMDGEYLVHAGAPHSFDKELIIDYIKEGYQMQIITIEKFKSVEWKWVYSKKVSINKFAIWIPVLPVKNSLEIGDLVFSDYGYTGIIIETHYNDADEVMVDWLVYYDPRTSIWEKPTIASRISTQRISKAIRLTKAK